MKSSSEIRQIFLDFFKEQGHTIVPSAPIVVKNDPTLLFTNAGMNQFKDYFLGNKTPEFSRASDTQKCLRVSGKHNDLEEVGKDHYHHTMFEMLGNWSFGNATVPPPPYFKKEAIAFAWNLLTEKLGISKTDLYATVFEGDESEGLPADDESFSFWKAFVPEDHILFGNKKDNFWEMGDTGPCGPCTEVHYDARSKEEKEKISGKDLVNKDHPEVIEIWNLVFIQFNRKADGNLEPLPARHVDTGMGFERLVRILQYKKSNYDTDIFSNTIHETEKITGKKYEGGKERRDIAFRVIADHIRAVVFTIADGQLPSNNGAGYVIRRILRRAVRYYFTYLDYKGPLLYKLVPLIAKQFENVFPEASRQKDFLQKVIHEEENSFLKTLGSGLKRLETILAENKEQIPGEIAFELFDTYGFPIDLTQLIASENNASVEMKDFEVELQKQKKRSRAATALQAGDWQIVQDGNSVFNGYEMLETKSHILKYRKMHAQGKDFFEIVLDQTPFYAESGGQVGDTGILISGHEKIEVTDTKKENNLIIHFTKSVPTNLLAEITARVNEESRRATMLHHSATHLLHAALRRVLGKHVAQKGSLVNKDHLRFDFSHFAKVAPEEIMKVEKMVNAQIRKNNPVSIEYLPKEEALKEGAMALFGEKYGDVVRVVTMDKNYSIELCGGTHVSRTGDIGLFKIVNETAVGASVRRIEAVCGAVAEKYIDGQFHLLDEVHEKLKNPRDILKGIDKLLEENNELKKAVASQEKQKVNSLVDELSKTAEKIGEIQFVGAVVPDTNNQILREVCTRLKNETDHSLIALASASGGKALVVIGVSGNGRDPEIDAVQLIKSKVSPLIQGGGGGSKDFAIAGGQDHSRLKEVIEAIRNSLC